MSKLKPTFKECYIKFFLLPKFKIVKYLCFNAFLRTLTQLQHL